MTNSPNKQTVTCLGTSIKDVRI